jgi:hypothetical protein
MRLDPVTFPVSELGVLDPVNEGYNPDDQLRIQRQPEGVSISQAKLKPGNRFLPVVRSVQELVTHPDRLLSKSNRVLVDVADSLGTQISYLAYGHISNTTLSSQIVCRLLQVCQTKLERTTG